MLSTEATQLLAEARKADHPVDLYLVPGTVPRTDRVAEVLRSADPTQLDDRALWNLLFAAGELSRRVDVYRAHELFLGAVSVLERVAVTHAPPGAPRGVAVEMCFDFFFARAGHPLVPLRAQEIISALARLLRSDARSLRRSGIHGLGHLIEHGGDHAWVAEATRALDDFVANETDAELRRYADEARSGQLR